MDKEPKNNHNLELQLELLKIVAEQSHEKILEYDVTKDIAIVYEVVDGNFIEKEILKGYFEQRKQGQSRIAREDRKKYWEAIDKCRRSAAHTALDIRYGGENEYQWYRLFLASKSNEKGKVERIAGRFVSIHQEKIAAEKMKRRAELDSLTGVYNHATFEKICERKLKHSKENLLFLMMDVDDFKLINDSQGHNIGDMVLSQTGMILKQSVEGRGIAGRLGGDEFAAFIWDFQDEKGAEEYAGNLRKSLKSIVFDMEYSASMGVSIRNGREMSFKDMYYEADQAVYYAKRHGKNQLVLFSDIKQKQETGDEGADEENFGQSSSFLDEALEYIYLVDPGTDELLFVNRAGREHLLLSEKEYKGKHCYEVLKGLDAACGHCDFQGNNGRVFQNRRYGSRYVDETMNDSRFLSHCGQAVWEGRKVRKITLVNLSDPKMVESLLKSKMLVQDTVEKCIAHFVYDDNPQEQKRVLQLIAEYYGADCIFVMRRTEDAADCLNEYHKETAALLAEIMQEEIKSGRILQYEELLDAEGMFLLSDISTIKKRCPELYQQLTANRIWSVYAKKLIHKEEYAGTFLLVNPRRNNGELSLLQMMCVYLAGDIIHKRIGMQRKYEADHDKLTDTWNLSNHAAWKEYWHDAKTLGVFRADILRLKDINRELGRVNGDARLRTLADVCKAVFTGYRVFRFDQDEFAVLCPDIGKEEFEKLIAKAEEKIGELGFGVTVGYEWSSRVVMKQLMEQAEFMMDQNRAKKENDKLAGERTENHMLEDVRKELEQGNFRVFLQPKVNINTGETVGAEALIRLYQKEMGIVGPIHFIPVLEQHNLVYLIDMFVFEEVFRFQQKAMEEGKRQVPISVNFSKTTLMQEWLLDRVQEIADKYTVPYHLIRIEITESVGDMDHIVISNVASELQKKGFRLSMDDFGTQYSNMEMLSRFHFDTAKIDRSMVKEITDNQRSCTVLKHLIAMIADLGIDCVVEGAETKEQVDLLKQMQCEVVQGYYFGRPVPKEEFYEKFM